MSLFRRAADRRQVGTSLGDARALIEILKLSRANLSAADAVLQDAEARLARGDTVQARQAVDRAERIANGIEEDYRIASEATTKLRVHVKKLRALGVPAGEEERAIETVKARVGATRVVEGVNVPDYAAARALAVEASASAEDKFARADRATTAIFTAELVLEGAGEAFGDGAAESLQDAQAILQKARTEVARGAFEVGATDAAVAERLLLGAMDQRRQAQETLESVQRVVAGLRGLGIPVASIQNSLDVGRTLLAKGKIAAAGDAFNRGAQEAVAAGTGYRQALDGMSRAMEEMEALRTEGLPTADAEEALAWAKAAVKAGNYALASRCFGDVAVAVKKQREVRDGLKAWINETKEGLTAVRAMNLPFVNDVEEMLARAEVEFANGDFAGSSEDLRIASLLMAPALKREARDRPEGPP